MARTTIAVLVAAVGLLPNAASAQNTKAAAPVPVAIPVPVVTVAPVSIALPAPLLAPVAPVAAALPLPDPTSWRQLLSAGRAAEPWVRAAEPWVRAAEPPRVPPAAAANVFEDFARAGERAFYGGQLRPGQQSAIVAPPARVRPEGDLPGEGELRRRMELPTLSNPQREEKVLELFRLGGAGPEVVTLKPGEKPAFDRFHTVFRQDAGRGRHNLWVVKPGRRADKIIVVGAHHDKVSVGEGKIDNWTGATLVANLYQAMKDEDTEATYVFIAFSREEEGLVGSDFFVRSLAPETKARIRSMVNIDTIGVDGTFSWRNNSARFLLDLIARVAKATGLPLKEVSFNGGDSDSSSFKRFTHAMTIFGASPEVIWDILHTPNDTMGVFSMPHYVNAAKLTLELLRALDREDPPRVAGAGSGLAIAR